MHIYLCTTIPGVEDVDEPNPQKLERFRVHRCMVAPAATPPPASFLEKPWRDFNRNSGKQTERFPELAFPSGCDACKIAGDRVVVCSAHHFELPPCSRHTFFILLATALSGTESLRLSDLHHRNHYSNDKSFWQKANIRDKFDSSLLERERQKGGNSILVAFKPSVRVHIFRPEKLGHNTFVEASERDLSKLRAWCLRAEPLRSARSGCQPAPSANNLRQLPTHTVDRPEKLRAIAQALRSDRIACIAGLGGTGKTCLALAYGHATLGEYPAGAWFVDAQGDPAAALVSMRPVLESHGPEQVREALARLRGSDVNGVADAIKVALESCTEPTLLILDGVDSTGWTALAPRGQVRILQTTFDAAHSLAEAPISPGLLTEDEALELCHQLAPATTDDERDARDRIVVGPLGLLPLAVKLAASTVGKCKKLGVTWRTYEADLAVDTDILNQSTLQDEYPRGLDAALNASFARCLQEPYARALLIALASFASASIPFDWAVAAAGLRNNAKARLALAFLRDLALVETGVDDGELYLRVFGPDTDVMCTLHGLVHVRLRQCLIASCESEWHATRQRALAHVAKILPKFLDSTRGRWRFHAHVAELLAFAEQQEDYEAWFAIQATVTTVGHSLHFTPTEVLVLLERAIVLAERVFGPGHAEVDRHREVLISVRKALDLLQDSGIQAQLTSIALIEISRGLHSAGLEQEAVELVRHVSAELEHSPDVALALGREMFRHGKFEEAMSASFEKRGNLSGPT